MFPLSANALTEVRVNDTTKLLQVLNLLWAERYGYPFEEWVRDRLDRGASYRQIERELDDLGVIKLSHVTLLKWFPSEREPVA